VGEGEAGRPRLLRSSLREQVADALREELMAGRLAAGRHFTVKEVADRYGVSATPVREALVDLSGQGLLVVEHHRGFAVPSLEWADFVEVMEAKVLVTDGIFRHLNQRLRQVDLARLPFVREHADSAVGALREGELDAVVGRDRRFWAEVGLLVGNRRVAGFLDWLRVQTWMFGAGRLRGRPELVRRCWSGHPELASLIAARDRAGVERLLHEEQQHWLRLMAALSGEPEPEGCRSAGVPAQRDGYTPGGEQLNRRRGEGAAGDVRGPHEHGLTH
jgi:DNA-binding GntR family transcriptional regulator